MTNENRDKLGAKLWADSYLNNRERVGNRKRAIEYANEALADFNQKFEADISDFTYPA